MGSRLEFEREYRRELRVVKAFVVTILLAALLTPIGWSALVAAVAAGYAFLYRRYVGWRWVLLPTIMASILLVGWLRSGAV
jgi:hypothetical protein